MKAPSSSMEASFVDTPRGIFTASGIWFRTTEALLRAYAGPVLEKEPLETLMATAERWLRSPATLALWALPPLLWLLGIWPALAIVLGVYILLAIWGPVFVSHWARPYLKLMDHVGVQALWYIVSMSLVAIEGRIDLMAVGLVFFIVTRWGFLTRILTPLLSRAHGALYRVPYPDQMLKSVIVRAAMKYRTSLPELDRIERFILNQIHRP